MTEIEKLFVGGFLGILIGAICFLFVHWVRIKLQRRKEKRYMEQAESYEKIIIKYVERFRALEKLGATWDIYRDEEYYLKLFKKWKV